MDSKLVQRYLSPDGAKAYRGKYRKSLIRRMSNRRELRVVRAALTEAGAHGHLLDCPCGAGRLTPTLLDFADQVTCADFSAAMVAEAQDALETQVEAGVVSFAVAPASDLPFEDGTFDTVVCHRLIHHMPAAEERAEVFAELARVSARRVVLSFSDDSTRKGRSQHRRGVARRRHALTPEALQGELAPHGLRFMSKPRRLNGWSSLVAVVVLEKVPAS